MIPAPNNAMNMSPKIFLEEEESKNFGCFSIEPTITIA